MQKLNLQVTSLTRKCLRYSPYKGNIAAIAPNRIGRRLIQNLLHQIITTETTEFKYDEPNEKDRMVKNSKLYLDSSLCFTVKSSETP